MKISVLTIILFVLSVTATTSAVPLKPVTNYDPLIFISNPIEANLPSHWMPLSIAKIALNKPVENNGNRVLKLPILYERISTLVPTTKEPKTPKTTTTNDDDEVIYPKSVPTKTPIPNKTPNPGYKTTNKRADEVVRPTQKPIENKTPRTGSKTSNEEADEDKNSKIRPTKKPIRNKTPEKADETSNEKSDENIWPDKEHFKKKTPKTANKTNNKETTTTAEPAPESGTEMKKKRRTTSKPQEFGLDTVSNPING
ncbi:nucleolar protein dao-5-like [Leguminivora glycinivorella]|uniref:nucleolar protein dao-5-like n=1 Tax=Leguminivora glycinivorella TaxID=1035111 RepID=UPI00201008B2|nr:nucleolar protein dao-5-like [Leguminivora glycinivorella]